MFDDPERRHKCYPQADRRLVVQGPFRVAHQTGS